MEEKELDLQQLIEQLNEAFVGHRLSLGTIDKGVPYGKGDVVIYLTPSSSYGMLNVSVLVGGVLVEEFDKLICVEVREFNDSSGLSLVDLGDLRASSTNKHELWCQLNHVPSNREIALEFVAN